MAYLFQFPSTKDTHKALSTRPEAIVEDLLQLPCSETELGWNHHAYAYIVEYLKNVKVVWLYFGSLDGISTQSKHMIEIHIALLCRQI